MNLAEMLSGMMGVTVIVGPVMHFIIGEVFAAVYAFSMSGYCKKFIIK